MPLNASEDTSITVRPRGKALYELSPWPFASGSAEYAVAGRHITPGQHEKVRSWSGVLASAPTVWESFRLVAA